MLVVRQTETLEDALEGKECEKPLVHNGRHQAQLGCQ